MIDTLNAHPIWCGCLHDPESDVLGQGVDSPRPKLQRIGRIGLIRLVGTVNRGGWLHFAEQLEQARQDSTLSTALILVRSSLQQSAGFGRAMAALERFSEQKFSVSHIQAGFGLAVSVAVQCQITFAEPCARVGWIDVAYSPSATVTNLPVLERVRAALFGGLLGQHPSLAKLSDCCLHAEQLEDRGVQVLSRNTGQTLKLLQQDNL